MLIAGVLLLAMAIGAAATQRTFAADATPVATNESGGGPIVSGDPRSDGEGPGIVGSPLAIMAGVIVLGLLTAVVTVVVVRLRGDP